MLKDQWSPEQISYFSYVGHEHIYQYVYKNKWQGGKLYLNLRQKRVNEEISTKIEVELWMLLV